MTHEPISIGPYWVLFYRSNFDVLKAGPQGAFVSIAENMSEWRKFCAMVLQQTYQGLRLNIDGTNIATLLGTSTPPPGIGRSPQSKVSVATGHSDSNGSG